MLHSDVATCGGSLRVTCSMLVCVYTHYYFALRELVLISKMYCVVNIIFTDAHARDDSS